MSRGFSIDELVKNAHPSQRAEILRAAAKLGTPRTVLPAPLTSSFSPSIEAKKPATTVAISTGGPVMNKTETRYQQRLRAEGHAPRFAALTLCLTTEGRRVRYTPDFLVAAPAGLELHEVKGAHVFEDGALKFKFAIEQWGDLYTFVWAQWAHGEWTIRRHERRTTAGA